MKEAFKKSFPYTIPVIIGYIFLGIPFGIMVTQLGYSPWLAPFISLTVYAGSMQFVLLPLLSTHISIAAIIIITLSVNIRMIFYGLPLIEDFKSIKHKFIFIHTLSDETFALDTSIKVPADIKRSDFFLSIGIINYIAWALASYLGAIIGNIITFDTKGIDFVLTALFLVLTIEQYRSTNNHTPFKIGLIVSIIMLTILGPGNFMLPSLLIIMLSLLTLKDKIEVKHD